MAANKDVTSNDTSQISQTPSFVPDDSLTLLCSQIDLQNGIVFEREEIVNRFEKWNFVLGNMSKRVRGKCDKILRYNFYK